MIWTWTTLQGKAVIPRSTFSAYSASFADTGVVVAHNHPAGQAVPSLEDREATLKLRDALSAVQIRLLDHIIVRGMEFASMKECGHLSR